MQLFHILISVLCIFYLQRYIELKHKDYTQMLHNETCICKVLYFKVFITSGTTLKSATIKLKLIIMMLKAQ